MRLLTALLSKKSNVRAPQQEPVPFKPLLPLKLKNQVSGKQTKSAGVACIQEMAVMFSCLKSNDFNQVVCSKEISSFQKCASEHSQAKLFKKEQERKGILTPGDRKMSFKQVNQILKKFPDVPPPVTHK